jgi:hypothetical protein
VSQCLKPFTFVLNGDATWTEWQLAQAVNPGDQNIYVSGVVIEDETWLYLVNNNGVHEVVKVIDHTGSNYHVEPNFVSSYAVGDYVRCWGYFPNLVYIGGELNEGWDDSGLYFSMEILARMTLG